MDDLSELDGSSYVLPAPNIFAMKVVKINRYVQKKVLTVRASA